MARSRIFCFIILLNLLHQINCLQRSVWAYDRKTDVVTITIDGITNWCPPKDILEPFITRYFNSINETCLRNDVDDMDDTDDPVCDPMDHPVCVPMDYIRNRSALLLLKNESSCLAPIPTTEETFERIDEVYRSSSLADDNPATRKWYRGVLRNLTRIKNVCRKNKTARLHLDRVRSIRRMALNAFTLGNVSLPRQRNIVADVQTILDEEMEVNFDLYERSFYTTIKSEPLDRERVFASEVFALAQDYDNELYAWYDLAKQRTNFAKAVSKNMKTEQSVDTGVWLLVRTRIHMYLEQAVANEMLAQIDYLVRDVAEDMKLACLPRHEYEVADELEVA